MGRVWLLCGCLFGLLSVGLGAFATHGLEPLLNSSQMQTLEIANRYMTYHGFALLTLGLWSHWEKWASSLWAGNCFVIGNILFAGSLYIYVFTGLPWVAMITPAGGSLYLVGWLLFAKSVISTKNTII